MLLASTSALGVTLSMPKVTVSERQVTVFWTTDVSATTEVSFGDAPAASAAAYPRRSGHFAPAGTKHSRTLRNLAAGKYYLRARSVDAAGNAGESSELTFSVAPTTLAQRVSFDREVFDVAFEGSALYLGGNFARAWETTGSLVTVGADGEVVSKDFPEVAGWVDVAASDGAGGYFLGGVFTSVGGLPRDGIAHLLPDLGVDADWQSPLDNEVYALLVHQGTLYAGGVFHVSGSGTARHAVTFDLATGAHLTTFAPTTANVVYAIAPGPNNGLFLGHGGGLQAVDASTGAPRAFASPAGGAVYALAEAAGNLYVGGTFNSPRQGLVVYPLGGGPPVGPDLGINGYVDALLARATRVYVGGSFGRPIGHLLAVDATTGQRLTGWNPQPNNFVTALGPHPLGLLVSGEFNRVGPDSRTRVALIDEQTGSALAFSSGLNAHAHTLIAASSASGFPLLVAGENTGAGAGVPRHNLAAVDGLTGALLPWNPDADGEVYDVLPQTGVVFAGGLFQTVGGVTHPRVAAIEPATPSALGAVLPSFNPPFGPASGPVLALAAAPINRLIVGGAFAEAGHVGLLAVGATSGALDSTFNANIEPSNGQVDALALWGTTLFVGGTFTKLGGVTQNHAGALGLPSGNVLGWNPGLGGAATDVAAMVVEGSTVYLAGSFTTPRPYLLAASASTGALVTGFSPAPSNFVYALAPLPSNRLAVGGVFSQLGSQYPGPFAVVDPSGAVQPGPDTDGWVNALDYSCAANLLAVGGAQSRLGATSQGRLALHSNGCPGRADIDDRQTGDLVWRRQNDGLYSVFFSSSALLADFAVASYGEPAGGKPRLGWTTVQSGISATSYTTPWALPAAVWTSLTEGESYVGVKVRAGAAPDQREAVLLDAFVVRKDTAPPSAPSWVGASVLGNDTLLGWGAASDLTSGVASYVLERAPSLSGPWTALPFTGPLTQLSHLDVGSPRPSHYRVFAVDGAGNAGPPLDASPIDDGGLTLPDGGSTFDAGVPEPSLSLVRVPSDAIVAVAAEVELRAEVTDHAFAPSELDLTITLDGLVDAQGASELTVTLDAAARATLFLRAVRPGAATVTGQLRRAGVAVGAPAQLSLDVRAPSVRVAGCGCGASGGAGAMGLLILLLVHARRPGAP